MRQSKKLVIATSNRGKFEEFVELLKTYPEIECVPIQSVIRNAEKLGKVEVYSTYEENALAKARLANHGCHWPCLGDDTGLEVDVLEKRPGIHTHRYAPLHPGMNQDASNIHKLLEELKGVPMPKRTAAFRASCALVMEGVALVASGFLEGTIAEAPMGDGGFGYDPIFIPKGFQKSLAQISMSEKNAISHRGKALQALMEQVRSRGLALSKP